MSRYSDTRAALKAAILEGDPNCPAGNVYDYIKEATATTLERFQQLFGRTLTDGTQIFHGAMFDRVGAPDSELDSAGDGNDDVQQQFQSWMIFRYFSFIDDPATGRISTYDFQEANDSVHDALHNSSEILALQDAYEMHIERVITTPIDRTNLGGKLCHFAQTTVTFRHER